jgi:hypothetical protein
MELYSAIWYFVNCFSGMCQEFFLRRDSGFKMQDAGYRIQELGFRIQDTRFTIQEAGFMIQTPGSKTAYLLEDVILIFNLKP